MVESLDINNRSPLWKAVRYAHLREHPTCAACGGIDNLEVHHKYPFAWPGGYARELEMANLMTLCEAPGRSCHLRIGHLGDYRSRNINAEEDAKTWLEKIRNRPYPMQFAN